MDEKLIERSVELWKRMLANPVYDNGDGSSSGIFGKILVEELPNNSDSKTLEAFGDNLREILSAENQGYDGYGVYLDVDYDPDPILASAAEKAGLITKFPWKTTMYICKNYIMVSAGYRQESLYHYPMSGGRWLITYLHGSDIGKVIELLDGGKPEFTIEGC